MIRVKIKDYVVHEGKMWFVTSEAPCLFCADYESGEILKCYDFPNQELAVNKDRMFMSLNLYDNKIWLLPFKHRILCYFDINMEKFGGVQKFECSERLKLFKHSKISGADIYAIGFEKPIIIHWNLANGELSERKLPRKICDFEEDLSNLRKVEIIQIEGNRVLIQNYKKELFRFDFDSLECVKETDLSSIQSNQVEKNANEFRKKEIEIPFEKITIDWAREYGTLYESNYQLRNLIVSVIRE